MLSEIKKHLKELGFNGNETKVYVALTQLGESPAAKIAKKIELPRTTVISILKRLEDDNYISTHTYKGTTFYWIESPRVIKESFVNRARIADDLSSLLTDLYRSEAQFPHGHIYDTKTSIKSFIEKLLISAKKNSVIYTIDSPNQGNYSKIYSENFSKTLNELKIKKGIKTKTLVPHGSFKNISSDKIKGVEIEMREMPEKIRFKSSFWIVDDFIILFSGNPPFISATKHAAIFESMKSIFEFLWSVSEGKGIK